MALGLVKYDKVILFVGRIIEYCCHVTGGKLELPIMKTGDNNFVRFAALVSSVLLLMFFATWGFAANGGGVENTETLPSYEELAGELTPENKAVIISCKKMISRALFESIKRRANEAIDRGATHIIFDVDTYGGDLYAADDITSYLLHELNPKAHTVAYISRKAISAGAMISVACEDIVMKEMTTIGDCAPISLGGKIEGVEREKIESFTRAAFLNCAQANGYPEALLRAMVSQQLEIFSVKNRETGGYEFFETKDVPEDMGVYEIETKKLVVKDDELLTLTALDAEKYGIARALVKDIDGVLEFLAERYGIVFSDEVLELKTNWSEEMVRLINHPAVMGVLVMLAMLGVYMELNTPGVGLPGLVALICVVIIVGSKYLVEMANWVEVAIFFVGVILLMVELFIPGFGIAGFMGIICIFVGLFAMLIKNPPDELPWPRPEFGGWDPFLDGVVGVSFGFIGFLILAYMFTKYLPKMYFLSGLMIAPAAKGGQREISMTAAAEAVDAQVNVGDVGVVVSPLRPAGTADFGGIIVDVIDEAQFLEKGVKVEIIEIHGNRVLVRKVTEE